jgi:hypothetical protein
MRRDNYSIGARAQALRSKALIMPEPDLSTETSKYGTVSKGTPV